MTTDQLTDAARSAALAENIVATIREPLLVLDGDFRVRMANAAFYNTFHTGPENTHGHVLFDLGSREWDIPSLRVLLERIIPEEEVFEEFEVTHAFPGIGTRTMLLNARLIPARNDQDVLILLAMEDVTERREAERLLEERARELARSNADLEQFAYVASHDLQEPLRMVSSYSDLLAARYGDKLDTRASEYIAYIVDGAQRMQRLIDDLLAFARATRGPEEPELVDTERAVARALRALRVAIEENGAVITHDALPAVEGHLSAWQQVFQNLVGNAIKFRAEQPPHIHISTRQEGTEWLFSVRDNGIGVDFAHRDRIFGLFQRLHGRSRYEGSGVGLALCKKIIEARGGRIWVESVPGEGATFWFTVPARGRE